MPVETAADRLAFLDTGDFACEVTYAPAGSAPGGGVIAGIFDSAYLELEIGGEVAAAARQPHFQCRVDDLVNGGAEGDMLTITEAQLLAAGLDKRAAGTYRVVTPQPDGTGFVDLTLHKA